MFRNILYSLFIFLLAFALRAYAIPHLQHVYYDEFTYLNTAENIKYHSIFSPTAMGSKDHVEIREASIRPNGYPFLLSLAFNLLGDSEETAFGVNVFLGAVSVVLVFWITYLIFNANLNIAFWSAIVFNFLPVHLKYSGSGSADISALFFMLASFLAGLLYLRRKKNYLLYLLIPITIYAAYIKPEYIILYFPLLILIFIYYANRSISKRDLALLLAFISVLSVPLLMRIPFMIGNEQINGKGTFLSLRYLVKNSLFNLQYLFDFRFHPLISTIFFVYGSLVLFLQERKKWLFLFGWFIVFYLIQSSYFVGTFSYLFSTDSDRRFFSLAIPFCILSGYGIHVILEKERFRLAIAVVIINLLIVNSMIATKRIVNFTFGRDVYKEQLFLKESSKQIPDDLYVITYNPPSIITAINKKAMDIDFLNSMKEYPRQVVLFKGFWWFERKDQSAIYENILKGRYNSRAIREWQIDNDIYGFYLLTLKS